MLSTALGAAAGRQAVLETSPRYYLDELQALTLGAFRSLPAARESQR